MMFVPSREDRSQEILCETTDANGKTLERHQEHHQSLSKHLKKEKKSCASKGTNRGIS